MLGKDHAVYIVNQKGNILSDCYLWEDHWNSCCRPSFGVVDKTSVTSAKITHLAIAIYLEYVRCRSMECCFNIKVACTQENLDWIGDHEGAPFIFGFAVV